jgi:hypothetical protein
VVKATVRTAAGTAVEVEGMPAEVEETVRRLESQAAAGNAPAHRRSTPARAARAGSIKEYVLELKESGRFKNQQGLADVQKALATEGRIIPLTTLSGVMLGLVKAKQLRRIPVHGAWKYVNR